MIVLGVLAGFSDRTLTRPKKRSDGGRSAKSAACLNVGLWNVSTSKDCAYGSVSASKPLSVHPSSDRSDNLTSSSAISGTWTRFNLGPTRCR